MFWKYSTLALIVAGVTAAATMATAEPKTYSATERALDYTRAPAFKPGGCDKVSTSGASAEISAALSVRSSYYVWCSVLTYMEIDADSGATATTSDVPIGAQSFVTHIGEADRDWLTFVTDGASGFCTVCEME